jgi:hypothetical protein
MSVHAHLRHRRPRISFPKPRWHASWIEHATVVVGSAILVLAVTLLLLALLHTHAAREPSSAGTATDAATTLTLPDGTPAFQEHGVLHVPARYAPPGIWTPKTGPGPVR